MKYTLLISGSGGQGVLSAGVSLAESASAFCHATYVPWYGAAQRGGTARCTVVLSDKPVVSPLPGKYMGLIAMNEDACRASVSELEEGGLLIRNSDRCASRIKAGGVRLLDVPAETMARELGDERMANNILIGALLGYMRMLPPELIEKGVAAKLGGKAPGIAEKNIAALRAGMAFGADPEHVKTLAAKKQSSGRYSMETTVGEILDTPKLRAIVEKMFPQVLNHPLLEAGRTFKFIDAVPYMKDMISAEALDAFADALEELE
ncbi:MAG: 2-oxoacid:acceptor oxidoreductase family protein [Oscillospiraceae bacterium]|nr:2-oxoacid:acceptor oxidoreductase family protein [Oscillospiraceae bacterium]